jgi:hypothetical protein
LQFSAEFCFDTKKLRKVTINVENYNILEGAKFPKRGKFPRKFGPGGDFRGGGKFPVTPAIARIWASEKPHCVNTETVAFILRGIRPQPRKSIDNNPQRRHYTNSKGWRESIIGKKKRPPIEIIQKGFPKA